MKGFAIIAACDARGGIGNKNGLPWKLSADMKHFRERTMARYDKGESGNVVIMGRRTWESLPQERRPLPGRRNVVLSTGDVPGLPAAVDLCRSLEDALSRYCQDSAGCYGRVFVIGGEYLYRSAIEHPLCDTLYLTRIEAEYDCDRYFPALPAVFHEVERSRTISENGVTFFFSEFRKADAR